MKEPLAGEPKAETSEDDLASGLPGLPSTAGGVGADESGLHYRGLDYSWDRISSLTAVGDKLVAEGRRLYRPSVPLFEASVVREDARPLEGAWREYLLRKIERDGVLKGTAAPSRLERLSRVYLLSALVAFSFSFFVGGTVLGELPRVKPHASEFARTAGAFAVPAIGAVLAAVFLALSVSSERRKRRLSADWEEWELRSDGLAVRRKGEERVLAPGTGDRVLFDSAVIGGEPVSLQDLTGWPLLPSVLLAMAERRGAAVQVADVRAVAAKFLAGYVFAGLLPAAVSVALGRAATGLVTLVGATFAVAALAAVSGISYARKRRELPRMVEGGREALRRLGW